MGGDFCGSVSCVGIGFVWDSVSWMGDDLCGSCCSGGIVGCEDRVRGHQRVSVCLCVNSRVEATFLGVVCASLPYGELRIAEEFCAGRSRKNGSLGGFLGLCLCISWTSTDVDSTAHTLTGIGHGVCLPYGLYSLLGRSQLYRSCCGVL